MEKSDFVTYRALVLEVRQIRALLSELEFARLSLGGAGVSSAPRGGTPTGSALAARSARYLDTKALYEEKLVQKEALLFSVESAIDSLASPEERLIMRARYIQGRSWTSICIALQREGYSERQVYRLHGAALLKLKEV